MTEPAADGRRPIRFTRWRRVASRRMRRASFSMLLAGLCAIFGIAAAQHVGKIETLLTRIASTPGHGASVALNRGVTFTVTCDTTTAGVTVQESSPVFPPWTSLACENNSTTSVFWGFGQSNGTAFDTSLAPCISTNTTNCLQTGFSVDAARGAIKCKSASSATLKCNAGGP